MLVTSLVPTFKTQSRQMVSGERERKAVVFEWK